MPAGKVAALALVLSLATARGADDVRLRSYPAAAYRGENVTFIFTGAPGLRVTATHNGKTIAAQELKTERLEFNLSLPGVGVLRFEGGANAFAFRIAGPREKLALVRRGGFLYDGDQQPVVLLAEHLRPPGLNREWETVRFLHATVQDTRPIVEQMTLVAGRWLSPAEGKRLNPAPGLNEEFWRLTHAPSGLYELDGLIAALPELKPAKTVCVALSANDLERGMGELTFRMKLEWYLQALQALPIKRVFVVSIPFSQPSSARFATANEAVKLAAQCCSARFVHGFFHKQEGQLTAARFVAAVQPHMEKVVKLQ